MLNYNASATVIISAGASPRPFEAPLSGGVFMKILHITKKYLPIVGGDAFVVYNLKKQQVKSGHKVCVVTSKCEEIEDSGVLKFGLREHPFNLDRITPRRIVSLILLSFWGLKNLRKLRPNIIHSHSADLGFFISIVARLYGIPVINMCHGISFNDKRYSSPKRFAEKFFLKYAGFKKIVSVDITGLEALKAAGIKNAVYIPNGVDLDRFRNSNKRRDNIKTRFLFVGRLENQKGLIYLIKAAEIRSLGLKWKAGKWH
ncbi:MAG: glycosyltransferase family 4 protein [Euryarchaeota archaeon]|nr:glycosyltransferase family 4 protein [Euryarchaeota archaeon]MBU4491185.1 glycosyltransferase family 4 protein [Euryarchaeota archaeon]